jgi:hypothetical protein
VLPETEDGRITLRNYTIQLRASQVHSIAPELMSCNVLYDSETTWGFPSLQLDHVLVQAWQELDPEGPHIMSTVLELPKIECTDQLPYRDANSEHAHYECCKPMC